jgi:hypothetical protein
LYVIKAPTWLLSFSGVSLPALFFHLISINSALILLSGQSVTRLRVCMFQFLPYTWSIEMCVYGGRNPGLVSLSLYLGRDV